MSFALPCGDGAVSHHQAAEGEEPGAVANVVDVGVRDALNRPAPIKEGVVGVKIGNVRLFRGSGAVDEGAQSLHFVIVPGVQTAPSEAAGGPGTGSGNSG